jgi:hypothetical protein
VEVAPTSAVAAPAAATVAPPAPAPAPVSAPVAALVDLSADEHVALLERYYTVNRPDNAPRARELFTRCGPLIWVELEKKYPGTTADFVRVLSCTTLLRIAWKPLCHTAVCVCDQGVVLPSAVGASAGSASASASAIASPATPSAPDGDKPPPPDYDTPEVVAECPFGGGLLSVVMYGVQESTNDGKTYVVRRGSDVDSASRWSLTLTLPRCGC